MMRHLVRALAMLTVVGLAGMCALGAPFYVEHTYLNPTPENYDYFGSCVAGVGGNALVGAPYDNTGASAAGAAYLFDGTTGNLRLTLLNPAPAAADVFGRAVAGLGANLLVGAPFDDAGAADAGGAYLFDGGTGALLRTFAKPAPAASDRLGTSVAGLGANVLAGAAGENSSSGAVYLFDAATGAVLRTFLNPTPTNLDNFGASVAAVGANVLVGAPGDDAGAQNAGAAYLLDGATGAVLLTLLNPTPAFGEQFGGCVATVGGNLLVGAQYASGGGAAYLFDGTTGGLLQTFLSPTPSANASFGASVAAVGAYALIGEPGNDTGAANAGAVFLFDVGTGALTESIFNPAPTDLDVFGSSVAAAGSKVLVGMPYDDPGATDAGAAYLFSSEAVPEPASLTLLVLGGLGLLARRRRRA